MTATHHILITEQPDGSGMARFRSREVIVEVGEFDDTTLQHLRGVDEPRTAVALEPSIAVVPRQPSVP